MVSPLGLYPRGKHIGPVGGLRSPPSVRFDDQDESTGDGEMAGTTSVSSSEVSEDGDTGAVGPDR